MPIVDDVDEIVNFTFLSVETFLLIVFYILSKPHVFLAFDELHVRNWVFKFFASKIVTLISWLQEEGFRSLTSCISVLFLCYSFQQKPIKAANADASSSSNAGSLKYIENFNNPYIKLIAVCKVCNKEQSLKFPSNWRTHYFTHAGDEEKPYQCEICKKGFITLTSYNAHMKKQHSAKQAQHANMKTEGSF